MKRSKVWALLLCITAMWIGAQLANSADGTSESVAEPAYIQSTRTREDTSTDEQKKLRWREGKRLVDHGGHFRQDGDGAIFVSETGHELVGLANLNLERVTRTLKASDESESIRWSVTGVVTEFNGRNYLLIQRAVYKSASPPPVPEQILN